MNPRNIIKAGTKGSIKASQTNAPTDQEKAIIELRESIKRIDKQFALLNGKEKMELVTIATPASTYDQAQKLLQHYMRDLDMKVTMSDLYWDAITLYLETVEEDRKQEMEPEMEK